jgi:hypothetical protein
MKAKEFWEKGSKGELKKEDQESYDNMLSGVINAFKDLNEAATNQFEKVIERNLGGFRSDGLYTPDNWQELIFKWYLEKYKYDFEKETELEEKGITRELIKEWAEDYKKNSVPTNQKSKANPIKSNSPKLDGLESKGLRGLIRHEKSSEIVEKIKEHYSGIKGKELKLLLLAFQELKLIKSEGVMSKFHQYCVAEIPNTDCSYESIRKHNFNQWTDEDTLKEMKTFLNDLIKAKQISCTKL